MLRSINPATGETLATFEPHGNAELDERLSRAAEAAKSWRNVPVRDRARLLAEVGAILDREKAELGRVMTLEMGKTLRSATDEAAKCALACRYYAEHAERFLAPELVTKDEAGRGEVRFLPLGVVLAVMPWNFPFWQVIRFAAPAIVAGNVGLLKHASNVPQCALALEDLFRRAGAPEGVFQTLLVGSDRVEAIIGDPRVQAVTLTGSEGAGRAVGAAAGRHVKKSVLELGGSDPFIVTDSADVERAASVAAQARIINNGQSCIAAKRFIAVESIADEFESRFVDGMRALTVGDPLEATTDVGPLATRQIVDDLDKQVRESVSRGARLLLGGKRLTSAGNYYEPTVLTDIPSGSPAAEEELFGPVAAVFRVRDATEAITVANDSSFGLAASVWTDDESEVERFANALDVGTVFVNGMVASDPRFPFGGVKNSGYGRELGPWGMREFVNVKTVRITAAVPAPAGAAVE